VFDYIDRQYILRLASSEDIGFDLKPEVIDFDGNGIVDINDCALANKLLSKGRAS